jgi:hypothetical protein
MWYTLAFLNVIDQPSDKISKSNQGNYKDNDQVLGNNTEGCW